MIEIWEICGGTNVLVLKNLDMQWKGIKEMVRIDWNQCNFSVFFEFNFVYLVRNYFVLARETWKLWSNLNETITSSATTVVNFNSWGPLSKFFLHEILSERWAVMNDILGYAIVGLIIGFLVNGMWHNHSSSLFFYLSVPLAGKFKPVIKKAMVELEGKEPIWTNLILIKWQFSEFWWKTSDIN